MRIKTHLCSDKDELISFIDNMSADLLTVKRIDYEGADGRHYEYEVRYK